MLTAKQRRSVLRVLIKAYYTYRDLTFLQICHAEGVAVFVDHDETMAGSAGEESVRIPGKCPKLYKEHVFWHELCHILAERFNFYPRLIGYQGHLQQFDRDGGYWFWERLCEAFADLMVLYRHLGYAPTKVEEFLLEDSSSIGYAEAARFSLRRIRAHCDKAVEAGRNIDLSDLRALQKHQERFVEQAGHQQMLPTAFYEHHQTPGPRFVDEDRDFEHRYRISKSKMSWVEVSAWERRLLRKIHSLQFEYAQPRLFGEMTSKDRAKIRRRAKRIDRFIKKYQQPEPRE